MKYGDLNLGQIEAIVNKLGGMDGVKGLLSGAMVVVKAVAEKLLKFVGAVMVSATEVFVVADHFTVNTSAMAEVKIGYLGDNFKKWFLGKTEEPNNQTELTYATLSRASVDKPILDELGNTVETTISMVWELLKLQPNGEGGVLLTNGYANIFYVRDTNNTLRAVNASWHVDDGGWYVRASSVGYPYEWRAGYRVFSRNSSGA